jgi:hypothetical protein
MSYDVDPLDPNSDLSFWPTTPMTLDILAIQYMYGANYDFNSGDDIYFFDDSTTYHETIWDGGGFDSIAYDGSFDVKIDLRAGYSSHIGKDVYVLDYNLNPTPIDNIWIAYEVVIEAGYGGGGNDEIIGNSVGNFLHGGEGDDILFGYADDDFLFGGSDNDVIFGGLGNDLLVGDGGDNYIDGGAGLDVALYNYNQSNYSILKTSTGFDVASGYGHEGVDTLVDVEFLVFADGEIDTSTIITQTPSAPADVQTYFSESNENHINYYLLSVGEAFTFDVSATYKTEDGTAKAGEDYVYASGIVTLLAGETSVAIPVEIMADNLIETNETFSLIVYDFVGIDGPIELVATHNIYNDDILFLG